MAEISGLGESPRRTTDSPLDRESPAGYKKDRVALGLCAAEPRRFSGFLVINDLVARVASAVERRSRMLSDAGAEDRCGEECVDDSEGLSLVLLVETRRLLRHRTGFPEQALPASRTSSSGE